MVPASVRDVLRDALAGQAEVRLAVLFGSAARGTATPESDVDVAVEVEPGADLTALAATLSRAVAREVDLVSLLDPGVPLLEELLRDGVVVHEGVPGAAARWRSHVLGDLELDRPWYARMRDAWLRKVAEQGLGDGQP